MDGDNGHAVVLLHGFTGTPGQFRMMGRFLNDHGYTVHAPLLPGHGTRLEDMATVTRHDWLDAARRAVDEYRRHEGVHVVGLSMGGLLTLNLDDVTSITTIDTPIKLYDWRWKILWLVRLVKPVVWFEEEETFDDEAAEYAIERKRLAWLETSRHNALLDPERSRLHPLVLAHLLEQT